MKITALSADIKIISYTAINRIQQEPDEHKKISSYTRSFRYESPNPLVSRRLAFFKLLDEKQGRLFYNGDPNEQFRGLSMYMEYLVPVEGKPNGKELKKLFLLTGDPEMSTLDQLTRWQKELNLLRQALPEQYLPVMPVEYVDGRFFEILESEYWIKQYYFYQ